MSALTRVAIRRVEDERMWQGAVVAALDRFERAFRHAGRYLETCFDVGLEVEAARDTLEEIMRHLPSGARRDLGRLIGRIDEEFERRTLPEPRPAGDWLPDWWWARVRER
ncbi:hypothetical protein AB0C52_05000 [Streptomyces sp. NPDC048717]|uniref:hypothetical protein n=1 Tax=unclassified Streptomyces TaxID=2593676 RepID=UPI00342F346C